MRFLTGLFFLLLYQPVFAVADDIDPLEGINRKVQSFNDTLDKYLLKPVAKGYERVTPAIVNRGVTNIFETINELPNAGNALLQGNLRVTGTALARFGVNATIGVLGFFDVATKFGLEEQQEDFGQTLAVWGVPDGPYLVLPFFGPSTIRDAGGLVVDLYASPLNLDYEQIGTRERNAIWLVRVVDRRADLLKLEEIVNGERYLFFKNTYLQNRNYLIKNGVIEDNFDDDKYEDEDWLEE